MSKSPEPGSRIAVVGGGVAGIVAAYLLQGRYLVTLFEADTRLGGHTNTVSIESGPDSGLEVDTGFIVLNDQTYPTFHAFLAKLGVAVRTSDMSFSYESRESGFYYAGTTLDGLFSQRRNIVSPKFYRFLNEVAGFCREGRRLLSGGGAGKTGPSEVTLKQFLDQGSYSQFMRESYLLPMAAAIWSAPLDQILDFPAITLLRFFSNHGLLSLRDRPNWQTVIGGSHSYIQAFVKSFKGSIRCGAPVELVSCGIDSALVQVRGQAAEKFDAVVIAAHADQALQIIKEPNSLEQELLGSWSYQQNLALLHTDRSVMPKDRRAWASWNYIRERGAAPGRPVFVSYHMNRLQGFAARSEYFVTLNAESSIDPKSVIGRFNYQHPVFDAQSVGTQNRLSGMQGLDRRYFCGSYFGYGFHEDAVSSAVKVGRLLEVKL